MKRVLIMLGAVALFGCGAAGEPIRPTANLGLSIGSGGVTPTASVGATNGPVSINVGL
ncbi:hypothetical protein SAMN04488515_2517 [Cognatiyoonia koreensis]|uniref:Argininosuccinate lyase n=1 Tax=Cognatiyoonia koreensis TaxID=364200 RepID=A0A1I0RDA6_9RHOB|nr:hypothetical protein [Cognatiyoonia koreensis]SEW38826.1 hypothetical protein SAMN04488515_2517 [Cognatiyoonia koreensis]